jgi:hypothetical protein
LAGHCLRRRSMTRPFSPSPPRTSIAGLHRARPASDFPLFPSSSFLDRPTAPLDHPRSTAAPGGAAGGGATGAASGRRAQGRRARARALRGEGLYTPLPSGSSARIREAWAHERLDGWTPALRPSRSD